jgi:glycosyltransferase involved in cell wall biosynthesis
MVRHMMLGLRAAGAVVHEVNTDERPDLLDTEGRPYDRGTTGPVWLRLSALMDTIDQFHPNLVVCNAGGLGVRPDDAARLRPRAFLLGIALSDPDVFEASTRHVAPHFDAFLTNAPACVARYEALGASVDVLPIATNEDFYHPVPPRAEMRCDVLLLGRAHPDRVEPGRALVGRFETHVYGEGWDEHGIPSRGLIFGDDVLAALSSAQASVVFFRTAGGHGLVKVGLFDFAAAGALVVTNRSAEVARSFAYGREILGFETTDDLLDVIERVLARPEEAERIRQAGRARVLRDHTWRVVWPRILGELRTRRKRS